MPIIITTTDWAKGVSGDWNNEADWTVGVPLIGGTALITVNGTYTVTSSQNNSAGVVQTQRRATLAIDADTFNIKAGTGTGALAGTITVNDGAALKLGADSTTSTFENNGAINVVGTDPTAIQIAGTVILNGKGKINLQSNSSEVVSDGSTATLTSSNTISGAGAIGDSHLNFVNAAKGVVDATSLSLAVDAASVINLGLMEATADGQLVLKGLVEQQGKGQIKTATGSQVLLQGATIDGGAISIAKNSTLTADVAPSTIETSTPIMNAGSIGPFSSDTLTIDASIKNTGLLDTTDGNMVINGSVTGGTADIGPGNLELNGAASTKVVYETGATGLLILDQSNKFKGTIAGMTSSGQQEIDLEDIPAADNPSTASKIQGKMVILTVIDSVKDITAVFKILDTTGTEGGGGQSAATDGSTLVYAFQGVDGAHKSAQMLAQSMASFGASSGATTPGGNAATEPPTLSFLAPSPHG